MSWDHSRRNFLKFTPATVALLSLARGVFAQNPGQGGATTSTNSNKPPANLRGGGTGGAITPGLAAHNGDFQPGKITRMHDRDKSDPPRKPGKDLAADQKNMRNEVQQLVRDTQELKNVVEQLGQTKQLSAELIGKTKAIEKLARDIAALAKG